MNTGQRTVATMLAVVALLLGLNLIVNLRPQEAAAQYLEAARARPPHVIQVETAGLGQTNSPVFRLWSDSVIEVAEFEYIGNVCLPEFPGVAWQELAETVALPPGVRITRIYTWGHHPDILLRLRSDGVVEQNYRAGGALGWCGWRTPPE